LTGTPNAPKGAAIRDRGRYARTRFGQIELNIAGDVPEAFAIAQGLSLLEPKGFGAAVKVTRCRRRGWSVSGSCELHRLRLAAVRDPLAFTFLSVGAAKR
jgi:hypothetical protein